MGNALRKEPILRPETQIGRAKRRVDILDLLDWAFAGEGAGLEFDALGQRLTGYGYVSSMAAILRHEELGCRIDGGGRSVPHDDAEIVADTLAHLPAALGGRRVALWVAELARTGRRPDPMTGVMPRVVAREWVVNRHGRRAKRATIGTYTVKHRGRHVSKPIECCPITYDPSPSKIASARAAWTEWRNAIEWLGGELRHQGRLTLFAVAEGLPPSRPWAAPRKQTC